MKIKQIILSLALLLSVSSATFGQNNDLMIYGYFQNTFNRLTVNLNDHLDWDQNSFIMQQMNIFFSKNFGPQLTSFVNLEFTNSFSSSSNIGNFKVEEAWLKYSPYNSLNIKGGTLIPSFNAMNEIKNRTVLLPYIYRPMVYETVFSSQFSNEDFVPTTAGLQIYGNMAVSSDLRFNYAAYIGNLSSENLLTNEGGLAIANDTSKFKLFGGRLGFEYENLAIGISGTSDRKTLNDFKIPSVARYRFGAYLNYAVAGFELEAEYIKVTHKLNAGRRSQLAAAASAAFAEFLAGGDYVSVPTAFDKKYYHVNLLYNITNQFFAYGGYDFLTTEDNIFSMGGLNQYTVGGGYRVTDAIVLKAQYLNQKSTIFGSNVDRKDYLAAASIYF